MRIDNLTAGGYDEDGRYGLIPRRKPLGPSLALNRACYP